MAAVPSIGRASLVERSRVAPQAAATEGLYERHAAKLQSYCLHQLGSREEAEDAVQTTYMNAFRALGRGIVPEAESAWLFKIAENVCLSRRRSSWRRGRIESPSDFEIIEEIIPGPNRQNDELIGIEDALASMPEQQRRAILLREWQGLSYREIAEELEVTQSAVETLIFRARRSLAAGLEQPDVGQEAEAQELPPRSARIRPRHGCRCLQGAARRERGRQGNCCCCRGHSGRHYRLWRRKEDRVEATGPRQPHRRRRWSASPRTAVSASARVSSPSSSARLAAASAPQRAAKPVVAKHASARLDSGCVGRDALGAAALHPGRRHARPGCAGGADPGGGAHVGSDFSSRGAAGGAAAHRRGQEGQRQANVEPVPRWTRPSSCRPQRPRPDRRRRPSLSPIRAR